MDHRSNILTSATVLFRRNGYNGVGIDEILALSGAPKGSLYHHYPEGKEQLAILAVRHIADVVINIINADSSLSTSEKLGVLCKRMLTWMSETAEEGAPGTCAFLATISSASNISVELARECEHAYTSIIEAFEHALVQDGWHRKQAQKKAELIVVLLEGGGIVSQRIEDTDLFQAAIEHAVAISQFQ